MGRGAVPDSARGPLRPVFVPRVPARRDFHKIRFRHHKVRWVDVRLRRPVGRCSPRGLRGAAFPNPSSPVSAALRRRSEVGDGNADKYFRPFQLACENANPKIRATALDCIQKLVGA